MCPIVAQRLRSPIFSEAKCRSCLTTCPIVSSTSDLGRYGRSVTTLTRSRELPNISTVSDFVPGYETSAWYGVGAPRGTRAEIVELLNKEINAGLADPKLRARLADLGGSPLPGPPTDFGKLV